MICPQVSGVAMDAYEYPLVSMECIAENETYPDTPMNAETRNGQKNYKSVESFWADF